MNDNDRIEGANQVDSNHAAKVSATQARQTLYALAIAKGESVRTAARAAGVSEVTGYRWTGNAEVANLANQYRKRIVRETIGRLAAMGGRAASRLGELIESTDESIALKAAIAALAEVRRIADATDGDAYRRTMPVVTYEKDNPLAGWLLLDDDGDSDDEPLPEPPRTFGMSKAEAGKAERRWQDCYEAIQAANQGRREKKREYQEQQRRIDAEVGAAELEEKQ